jgi:hypothetical protein
MKSQIKANQDLEYSEIRKATFVSYIVSLYVSSIQKKNSSDNVSVEEIYEFIEDLKKMDSRFNSLFIKKRDISLCFYILDRLGVCRCLK